MARRLPRSWGVPASARSVAPHALDSPPPRSAVEPLFDRGVDRLARALAHDTSRARRRLSVGLVLALLLTVVVLSGPVVQAVHPLAADRPGTTAAGGGLDDGTVTAGEPLADGAHAVEVDLHHLSVEAGADRVAAGPDLGGLDGWALPLPAFLLGYTRHADAEPLANDVRQRIYEQIVATPGAHIAAIVEGTDVPRSTARYHLAVLEEAGLVDGGMVSGKHRYAPTDVDLEVASALHDGPARTVFDGVARFEPVSVTGLADVVDRAPSTVSHHLDRLAGVGLLERERTDGRVEVRLLPAARQYVDEPVATLASSGPRAGLTVE